MRISRKQVDRLLNAISDSDKMYELVRHQNLGDRKDYYYTYSIVVKVPNYSSINFATGEIETKDYQTGWKYLETLISNVELRAAYYFALHDIVI